MPRFTISVPDEINARLEEEAKKNQRSKSGQVAFILSLFFGGYETEADPWAVKMLIDKGLARKGPR